MSVAPANNAETQASSLLQGSPVASLLGQAPVSQQFQIFQSMIKSPQVASELDRRYQVSRRLFAESWDGERQVWRAPRTVKIFLKSIMYGLFGLPAWAPPDAMQLSGYLGNQIQVVPDGINVYQISYSYTDQKFAQWFLGAVVQLADARTLQVTKN